ncbi:hypothetical protein LCGC14_0411490 [marine sediment metagenome]|uniref:Uncharacterized protein n=1 Tax=marine sediment metagenome TaxID=412755 RepID=A0A0F9TBK3_9ZZZZ
MAKRKTTFALLGRNKEQARVELEQAVREFADDVRGIKRKYPTAGIYDTATKEAISSEVYRAIHR